MDSEHGLTGGSARGLTGRGEGEHLRVQCSPWSIRTLKVLKHLKVYEPLCRWCFVLPESRDLWVGLAT